MTTPIDNATFTPSDSTAQQGVHAQHHDELARIAANVYSVVNYGADPTGVADSTAAIQLAVAALQAAGKGTLLFQPGTYKVTGVDATTLFALSNLSGVSIVGYGATIADATLYTGTQVATLFKFTACNNVSVTGLTVTSQVQVPNSRGLDIFYFVQGCIGVTIDAAVTGGRIAVGFVRLFNDPDSYRCRHINIRLKATNTEYPLSCQHSGDEVVADLQCVGCGRNYFPYGVSNHKINIRSKNQKISTIIQAYSGFGCNDIDLTYHDRDSDANTLGSAAIQIGYGDTTAATHKNIRIRVNFKNPSGSPAGNTVELYKESAPGTLDNVARGHVLDGLEISGISEQTSVYYHFNTTATFATTDVIRNVTFRNLTLLGAGNAWQFVPGTALVGQVLHQNIYSDHYVYCNNGSTGRAIYLSCNCAGFTGATTSTDLHTYISCKITDGSLQSVRSKRFLDTAFATDELHYGEFTANVSPVVTTEGTAATVVTAAAIVFDGSTKIKVEFFTPRATKGTTNIVFALYDGAASIGLLGSHFTDGPVRLEREFTPAAATKTYSIRAYVDAGTGLVAGGAGGLGLLMPGFIRITKVA